MAKQPFWRAKSLKQMSRDEWESLCDGCGKCCLLKLDDEDGDGIDFTDVSCRLLDRETCRCNRYDERKLLVPDCVMLRPDNVGALKWMPSTCAYRLIAEGKDLEWWHPLVSGDSDTVHLAGISVRDRVIPETEVADHDLEDHIVDWPR
jgi:uncharacterized cysteine cluster protein YcgN (CxxCxxCC family)